MKWKVNFFKTKRGASPVEEFVEQQDRQTIAKVLHSIELLEENGPFLRPPYSKKLAKSLYELRILGRNSLRMLYTFYKNEYFLLLAFKKKTQKTPKKEIKTALDRMKEIS